MNPLFVDADNGDYHLSESSPCIGAGTASESPDIDIEGNPRPNPAGSNPDMGAYENSRSIPGVRPIDIFGIEIYNSWTFQGTYPGRSYSSTAEVILIDQTNFPTTTHVIEYKVNGTPDGKSWYETTSSKLNLWGEDFGDFYKYSKGLLAAWYPMKVKADSYSTAKVVFGDLTFNISLTVDVLKKEPVKLSFDTLEAYKLSYIVRVWGNGQDMSNTTYRWAVPYLGFVKYTEGESVEVLKNFAIASGIITEKTDADGDELKDYQELIIYKTNWRDSDTDDDGMPDGWEVAYGLNPKRNDASEDADGDGFSNLIEFRRKTDPKDPDDYPTLAMPWIPLLLDD